MFDTEVLVLGGGPAGLAAAMAAARRGMRVMLAEASRPPIDKACGEGLMPDSQAAAARLGIAIPGELGYVFRGIRFLEGRHAVGSCFPSGAGLGVRRTVLHEALTNGAAQAGVELRHGVPFTALDGETVTLGKDRVRARWIIGADGSQSSVRRWAGLESFAREDWRFGFRRHFRVAPWSEFMEIHWGEGCQFYITPVAGDEICLVLMSRDPHLRLREALRRFPELERRFPDSLGTSAERGSPAGTRLLHRVTRANVGLIGDASGSVDAITGEGMCLAFQQAEALAVAMEADDLSLYERAHRAIRRRPVLMGDLMLALDRWPTLRRRALPVLARQPKLFEELLSLHVGEMKASRMAATAAGLVWGVVMQ